MYPDSKPSLPVRYVDMYTYHDVCRLDLFLLRRRASHRLLQFQAPPDGAVDAGVEEDEEDVGKQLRQDRLGPEVVEDDVVLVRPEVRDAQDASVVLLDRLEARMEIK